MITAENLEKMLYRYQYWLKPVDPERLALNIPIMTEKWNHCVSVLAERNSKRDKKNKVVRHSIITMEQLLKYLNKDKNNKYGSTKYNRAED